MQQTVEHPRAESDLDVLRIAAADKLDNVRAIRDTLSERGPTATWALFNAPRDAQIRYYRAVADALTSRRANEPLFQLLQLEVQSLFPPARSAEDTRYFYAKELWGPEQARPYLADPKVQWKQGRSAYELAHSWIGANTIPSTVEAVLESSERYRGSRLVEGLFERQVNLRTPGRSSQTDLLALLKLRDGHAVVAVEGKAGESFDKTVAEWNDSAGKEKRLASLCSAIGIQPEQAGALRYQLLHRTVSALYEAERYGVSNALMLVHAFADDERSFEDFTSFARAIGTTLQTKNAVSEPVQLGGVDLQLAWVQDRPADLSQTQTLD